MAILSPMKGIHKWLSNNGYVGKKQQAESFLLLLEYKSATGNAMNLKPIIVRAVGDKPTQQQRQFAEFTKWVMANKTKIK